MEEKKNRMNTIIIVILVLMLCASLGYIVYNNFFSKEEVKIEKKETDKKEEKVEEDNKEEKENRDTQKDEEEKNKEDNIISEKDNDESDEEYVWGKPSYNEDGKYNYYCYKEDSDEGYGCHKIHNLIVNDEYYSAFLTFDKNILKLKYSENDKSYEIKFENDIVDIVSGGSCAGDSEHVIIDSKGNLYYYSYEGEDGFGHNFGQKLMSSIEDFEKVLIKVNKGDIKKIYQYNIPGPCGSTHIVYDDSNGKGKDLYKYIEENR